MLDIRYHMFYLCAVFLMMGFGILIGEAVYPHQVRAQVKSLQALREEANQAILHGQAAQEDDDKIEGVIDHLRPALVRGKLTGHRVIVLLTGDYPDAAQSAIDALTAAGATVGASVTMTDGWSSLSADATTTALHQLAALLLQGTGGSGTNRSARDGLETQGLISVQGDLSKPTTQFVLVGGFSDPNADPQAPLDIGLISQLDAASQNDAQIVGCEVLNATVSVVQAYQDAGLATVDRIDQPLGQLDLPFTLCGQPDSYGLKPTATRQLPPTLAGTDGS